MFDKVLVANRGEIAVRIARTLRHLGIGTVAVFSEADRHARHVLDADEAVLLGPPPAAESYLRADLVVDAAIATGAQAVHPGYGLLSEDAAFAEACEAAGLAFVGPTPDQLRAFGRKHTARALAAEAGVPLLAGSDLVVDVEEALATAEAIGYPVMLKASAGGGGIGMRRCHTPDELRDAFGAVVRQAEASFGGGGVFLERFVARARHVEVQAFGDGEGGVVLLGERDCSIQRRNQKVLEESPAPGLPDATRATLLRSAEQLLASVRYRSAGTVEFVVDVDTGEAAFLEVNTRLQVEHGVTELRYGVDLVEWMVRLAAGEPASSFAVVPEPTGHAIEARLYAEDPLDGYRPCAGLVTAARFPDGVRVDTWVEAGTEVSPWYDPLLAKVLVHAPDRPAALAALDDALVATRIGGVQTNRDLLVDLVRDDDVRAGRVHTAVADHVEHAPPSISVLDGGMFTTVQDLPGRLGLWDVGVPPSGPMDDRSLALVNQVVGNPRRAAGLECTVLGPTLRFATDALVALGGAAMDADLDGRPVPWWTAVAVRAGQVLRLGEVHGAGSRTYLAVAGGIDVPEHLGSRSTFVLGRFGGHAGRTLRTGDVLPVGDLGDAPDGRPVAPGTSVPEPDRPALTRHWQVGVLSGPHGAPDFFTPDDIAMVLGTDWQVHHHSDRTGVRLIGPRPTWARPDGGEAGLHPSNIHDNAYAVGTVDFTGDMPIVLLRDGPSCGGFVCPFTVAAGELWKLGQARAGDTVRFVPVTHDEAVARLDPADQDLEPVGGRRRGVEDPVLAVVPGHDDAPELVVRRDGDHHLLVEVGPAELDLALRLRVGALMADLAADPPPGLGELVPGVRSLQVGFDPDRLRPEAVADLLADRYAHQPSLERLEVPSRIVHLPLSWDDPATRQAIDIYMRTVRADAPWCPWNIEFIRRINGLASVDDVQRIVFDASYLVLALGDVYLGAPVATPLDPRHRLVTTKYNPARTWTAESSVGIGGAYLCIYGMEGPGGYQFVGRTVQVWNSWRSTPGFEQPWLLRFFDQIRWEPVTTDELTRLRDGALHGRHPARVEPTTFRWADHLAELDRHAGEIAAFTERRRAAFAAERARWAEAGLDLEPDVDLGAPEPAEVEVPTGHVAVRSPVAGSVWKVLVHVGDRVEPGDPVVVVEAMKMETSVRVAVAGRITDVRVDEGGAVQGGGVVVVVEP